MEALKDLRDDPLYSLKDGARLLGGVSVYMLERQMVLGKLRRTKVGRRTMIRLSELKKLIVE